MEVVVANLLYFIFFFSELVNLKKCHSLLNTLMELVICVLYELTQKK